MSGSESWICQFCGLVTAREEKPDAGLCGEREGAAHVWVKTSIVSDDKELTSRLLAKVEARRELVESAVRGALGEKLRDGDVEHAWEEARERQIEGGDSWQAAISGAAREAAADFRIRTVRGWVCLACGMSCTRSAPNVESAPASGPACGSRSGAGHMWSLWLTPSEFENARERWVLGVERLEARLGEGGAARVVRLLREGKGYLEAVKIAEEEGPVELEVDVEVESAPAVEAPPVEARRGRGRPPKAAGAVKAPVVPASEPVVLAPRPAPISSSSKEAKKRALEEALRALEEESDSLTLADLQAKALQSYDRHDATMRLAGAVGELCVIRCEGHDEKEARALARVLLAVAGVARAASWDLDAIVRGALGEAAK